MKKFKQFREFQCLGTKNMNNYPVSFIIPLHLRRNFSYYLQQMSPLQSGIKVLKPKFTFIHQRFVCYLLTKCTGSEVNG